MATDQSLPQFSNAEPYLMDINHFITCPIRLSLEGHEINGEGYQLEDLQGALKWQVYFTYEAMPEDLRASLIARFREQKYPLGSYVRALVPPGDILWVGDPIAPRVVKQHP